MRLLLVSDLHGGITEDLTDKKGRSVPQLSHVEAKIAVGRWLGLLFHGGLLATSPPALPLLQVTLAAPGTGM